MASRVARYVLETCILAFGVVPSMGLPQSPSAPASAGESERIAENIRAAQAENGAQSAALIVPLTELGGLYEAEGARALAIAAFEQARQIVRATYGPHTLDQVSLLERVLVNQQALGNFETVWALEEELFDLAERHPDDLRTVAIHRNIGARRTDLLRRFLAGEAPPEIYPVGGFYSFQRSELVQELVSEAQIHYADAAAVILRNGLYSSDELRDLEMEIVRASDLFRQRYRRLESEFSGAIRNTPREDYGVDRGDLLLQWWNYTLEALRRRTNMLWDVAPSLGSQDADTRRERVDDITTRYQLGRESYLRLIAYHEAVLASSADAPPSLRDRMEPYLQIADWDLLYSANGQALDQYANVHAALATARAEPLIASLFAPAIPIVLPTFLPNPLETQAGATYIDVAFEITKYGESRRIEIRGAAPNVSEAAKQDVVNLIKSSRFRPRVTDGELGRASPVVVRYYLND